MGKADGPLAVRAEEVFPFVEHAREGVGVGINDYRVLIEFARSGHQTVSLAFYVTERLRYRALILSELCFASKEGTGRDLHPDTVLFEALARIPKIEVTIHMPRAAKHLPPVE